MHQHSPTNDFVELINTLASLPSSGAAFSRGPSLVTSFTRSGSFCSSRSDWRRRDPEGIAVSCERGLGREGVSIESSDAHRCMSARVISSSDSSTYVCIFRFCLCVRSIRPYSRWHSHGRLAGRVLSYRVPDSSWAVLVTVSSSPRNALQGRDGERSKFLQALQT